jgi:hypothetical protein
MGDYSSRKQVPYYAYGPIKQSNVKKSLNAKILFLKEKHQKSMNCGEGYAHQGGGGR